MTPTPEQSAEAAARKIAAMLKYEYPGSLGTVFEEMLFLDFHKLFKKEFTQLYRDREELQKKEQQINDMAAELEDYAKKIPVLRLELTALRKVARAAKKAVNAENESVQEYELLVVDEALTSLQTQFPDSLKE